MVQNNLKINSSQFLPNKPNKPIEPISNKGLLEIIQEKN